MAEKTLKQMSNVVVKPLPMKLFAAWEVDRTPPNCTPRLCTLTLTRLVLLKPLGGDFHSVIIAVKMQSSKRTLRSNEIVIPSSGLLDTELDLTFSLQYPHFIKRNGNYLHIMLQRRKRYKNRAILGFKTLAAGIVNMAEVLQKPMDKELDLFSNEKEKREIVSRVMMLALSSQPVEHDEPERQKISYQGQTDGDRGIDVDNFSDEDEEFSSPEEGSDSEPPLDEAKNSLTSGRTSRRRSHLQKTLSQKMYQGSVEDRPDPIQRNIKQKFIALLKKFKVSDAEYQEDLEHELISQNPQEIDLFFDEMEDLTDSGPEVDDASITSTPKPSLRPFFSTTTLVDPDGDKASLEKFSDDSIKRADSDSHQEGTDQEGGEANSPPKTSSDEKKLLVHQSSVNEKKPKLFNRDRHTSANKDKKTPNLKDNKEKTCVERTNSYKDIESSPRKTVMDQLAKIFPSDESIPDHIFLLGSFDFLGQTLTQCLQDKQQWVILTQSGSDIRACFACLVNKIQKFCNCNNRAPSTIRIGVVGQDCFINLVLRMYVEHFASKPPDWQNYIRFHIVPLGSSLIAKHVGSVDNTYGSSFIDSSWKDLCDHVNESTLMNEKTQKVIGRIMNYFTNATTVFQLPIAEAMVTYKEKSSDDESSQVFIPFISDVKVGMMEGMNSTSVDDESSGNLYVPGSSPPSNSQVDKTPRENVTPPSSPSITSSLLPSGVINSTPILSGETMELQVDYWTLPSKSEAGKKSETSKLTLKTTFRTLQISRLPSFGETTVSSSLTFSYLTKEKKQKIMRLGKKKEKDREMESRYQVVEGIHRLICSCKNPGVPLKVSVDGVEWTGVKFFQLTAQWPTHIRYFPVAVFYRPEHAG